MQELEFKIVRSGSSDFKNCGKADYSVLKVGSASYSRVNLGMYIAVVIHSFERVRTVLLGGGLSLVDHLLSRAST